MPDLRSAKIDRLQIPDAALAALLVAGVEHVLTLLSRPTSYLQRVTGASLVDVTAWKCRAELMHVLDAHSAIAAQVAGVSGLNDLAHRPLSWLRSTLMTTPARSRLNDDELAQALVLAAQLATGGSLTVVVTRTSGARARGVDVRYGSATTTTDRRGIGRLVGLPLGAGLPLVCGPPQSATVIDAPVISRNVSTVVAQPVVLERAQASKMLDEFLGDELPPLVGTQMRERKIAVADLREGELVVVGRSLVDGTVQLVSKYRQWQAGTLFVRVAAADPHTLPAGAAKATQLTRRGGVFVALTSVASLAEHRALLRLDTEFADSPAPRTRAQSRALVRRIAGRGCDLGLMAKMENFRWQT